jgi:hypothetical protein
VKSFNIHELIEGKITPHYFSGVHYSSAARV